MVRPSVAALQSSMHHVNNDLPDEQVDLTLGQRMGLTWDRIANRSVIIRALPRAILAATITLVCQVLRDSEYSWFSASIKHPMAIQVFGIMLAFLLTNRVVRAMNRWWDGLMAVNTMYNKWYDAFSFLMITIQKEKKMLHVQLSNPDIYENEATWIAGRLKQLETFGHQMIHWFSLTNALCLGTLKYGEDNCVSMIKCKPNTSDFPWLTKGKKSETVSPSRERSGKCAMDLLKSTFEDGKEFVPELQYLGDITADEESLLGQVDDKMYLAVQLITQALVIADTEKLISIPPSLLNRTYTLIQGGVDAYQNAYKIAAVPYPFPLAQTMDALMAAFVMLMPIVIEKFTASLVLSPVLSFLIAMSYWALNRAAKELENPFGEDANDLPLHDFCASFNDHLEQMSSLQVKDEMDRMFRFSEIFHGPGRMPTERPTKPAPPVAPPSAPPVAPPPPPPHDRSASSASGPSIDRAEPEVQCQPQYSREQFPPSVQKCSAELYAQVQQDFLIHVPSVYHDMPSPIMRQVPPQSGQDIRPRLVRRALQGRHVMHAPQPEFYLDMVPSDAYYYATDPYSKMGTDLV